MQKLLNEWRAYIREAKNPKKPAKFTAKARTVKCPGGLTGVAANTPGMARNVVFCPSEADVKARADMKLYKDKISQVFDIIKNSKEALNYLKDNVKDERTKRIYNNYKFLIGEPIENIIGEFNPWEPGSKMDGIRTKENYNKKFESIMDSVIDIYNPLINPSIELQENIPMQVKLGGLYENVKELFKNIGEYHKASLAY